MTSKNHEFTVVAKIQKRADIITRLVDIFSFTEVNRIILETSQVNTITAPICEGIRSAERHVLKDVGTRIGRMNFIYLAHI